MPCRYECRRSRTADRRAARNAAAPSMQRESPRRRDSRASRVPTPPRVSPDRRASGTAYREGSAWTCSRFWCRRACVFAGKKRTCLFGIGADLAGERGQIRVAFLVAELVQEFDHDAATVDRIVEIENKYFEQRTRVG